MQHWSIWHTHKPISIVAEDAAKTVFTRETANDTRTTTNETSHSDTITSQELTRFKTKPARICGLSINLYAQRITFIEHATKHYSDEPTHSTSYKASTHYSKLVIRSKIKLIGIEKDSKHTRLNWRPSPQPIRTTRPQYLFLSSTVCETRTKHQQEITQIWQLHASQNRSPITSAHQQPQPPKRQPALATSSAPRAELTCGPK